MDAVTRHERKLRLEDAIYSDVSRCGLAMYQRNYIPHYLIPAQPVAVFGRRCGVHHANFTAHARGDADGDQEKDRPAQVSTLAEPGQPRHNGQRKRRGSPHRPRDRYEFH